MASRVSFSPGILVRPKVTHRTASFRPSTNSKSFVVPIEQHSSIKTSGRTLEECEAAAVAGNIPAPPPLVNPAGPKETPKIKPLDLPRCPRRNRKSSTLRSAFQETTLSPANFVLPLFIHDGRYTDWSNAGMLPTGVATWAYRGGLQGKGCRCQQFCALPKNPGCTEDSDWDEAYNDNGVVPRSICLLKDKFPDIVIYTDVHLDPYSSDGHDSNVRKAGIIMNDEAVFQLCKQAVCQARAGVDVVSPSDMMDGRVGAIREALDAEGFHDVSIMSYTAKYASAFYGPFLDSNPRFGDEKTCQMNPANYREALIETEADEAEGADILLVKPALPYLDVIHLLRDNSSLPIAAYQVSGEYSMIKAAGALKMIDEEMVMMESLMCIRRAGADIILSYFARRAAGVLCGTKSN